MKHMNLKRFGAVVMAGALALSMMAPAFAAGATQEKNSTIITGAYAETPIAVTVPTTGTAKINPFGLPVSMTKSDGETKVNIVGQQITHEVLSVRNNGDVALDMGVKAFSVLPKGGVSIAASKDTDKAIKVDLQVKGLNDAKYAVASTEETLPDLLMDAFADDATWAGATALTAPAVAANATALPTGTDPAATSDNSPAAVLGAATVSPDGEVTYGNNSIALFRLKGDMAKEPKTGTTENPWETADGFTATVVFKFIPHEAVPASVTIAPTTLSGAAAGSGTLNATFDAGESGLTVSSYAWNTSTPAVATVSGTTAVASVTYVNSGTTNITCVATLSDGSTVTSNACVVTVS